MKLPEERGLQLWFCGAAPSALLCEEPLACLSLRDFALSQGGSVETDPAPSAVVGGGGSE